MMVGQSGSGSIKMQDILFNIDNKEILNEVLNYSIDYLIGISKNNTVIKSAPTISSMLDFENSIQKLANSFKLYILNVLTETELLMKFSHMSQDLQQTVLNVVNARKPEIVEFLMRHHNSLDNKLVVSFDWDVRVTLSDSNNPYLRENLTTIQLNCLKSENNDKSIESTLVFELDKEKLNKFINVLEDCQKKLNEIDGS